MTSFLLSSDWLFPSEEAPDWVDSGTCCITVVAVLSEAPGKRAFINYITEYPYNNV